MTPELKSLTRLVMAGYEIPQWSTASALGINQRTLSKWIFSDLEGTPEWEPRLVKLLKEHNVYKGKQVNPSRIKHLVYCALSLGYNTKGRPWKAQYRIENDPIIKEWMT